MDSPADGGHPAAERAGESSLLGGPDVPGIDHGRLVAVEPRQDVDVAVAGVRHGEHDGVDVVGGRQFGRDAATELLPVVDQRVVRGESSAGADGRGANVSAGEYRVSPTSWR